MNKLLVAVNAMLPEISTIYYLLRPTAKSSIGTFLRTYTKCLSCHLHCAKVPKERVISGDLSREPKIYQGKTR